MRQYTYMSASKAIKEAGLASTVVAADISNKSRDMLERTYYSNKQFFDVIIAGCVSIKEKNNEYNI